MKKYLSTAVSKVRQPISKCRFIKSKHRFITLHIRNGNHNVAFVLGYRTKVNEKNRIMDNLSRNMSYNRYPFVVLQRLYSIHHPLTCCCQCSGTLLPQYWHCRATILAKLCQLIGTTSSIEGCRLMVSMSLLIILFIYICIWSLLESEFKINL